MIRVIFAALVATIAADAFDSIPVTSDVVIVENNCINALAFISLSAGG